MSDDEDDSLHFSELEEYSDDSDLERMETLPFDKKVVVDRNVEQKIVGLKHLTEMKALLGLDSFKEKKARRKERKQRAKARKKAGKTCPDDGSKIVHTLASRLKSKSAPELVIYSDPRKRKKKPAGAGESTASLAVKKTKLDAAADDDVSMKQARFDVFKFGLSGFGKSEKADAETAQLIRLGAKPGKNKCVAYAEFKEIRKKEREEEKRMKEEGRRLGMRSKRSGGSRPTEGKAKSKKKTKKKGGEESIQTKVGRFDGGMLKLSAKDVAAIKGSKK